MIAWVVVASTHKLDIESSYQAGVDRHRDPFLTERYITVEEADRLMECPTRGEAVEVGSCETVYMNTSI